MTARLRVAALGAGYFGQFHYRAWSRLPVDLVGICDRDEARAAAVARGFPLARTYGTLDAMLEAERPDLLDVITPPASHLDAIRTAAAQGVDVICQKPFCGSLAAAEEAVAIARQTGITLIVHENFRFQPWYAVIHDMLHSGQLGEVYGATFRLRPGDGQGPDAYLDRQPYFRDMPRFVVHETGVHYVDVFRYLLGEVTAVTARLRRINPAIAGEDAGIVVLEMAGGASATLDANRLSDHCATNRRRTLGEMLIEAERGVLRLTGDGMVLLRRHGENAETPVPFDWDDVDFGGDCVYRTQQAALAALTGNTRPVNTAEDYLVNLRIEEAIYASDRQGRRISLDQADA
jgi:predicted dehydrogenase